MAQQITENMIREAAYFLWEKAGRPDGSAEYFWMKACEQFFKPKKVEIKKPALKKAQAKKVVKPAPKAAKKVVKTETKATKKVVAPLKKPTVKVFVRQVPVAKTEPVKKVVIKVQPQANKTAAKKVEPPFYGSRR